MKGSEKKDSNFPDVKGRWSESAIAFLTEQGIVNGYPDGTFRPANRITREEFAKLLYGYLSKKIDFSGISGKNFSDTDGSWASEAISKLGGAGIIDGYQDGSFGKGKSLSRAEDVSADCGRCTGAAFCRPERQNWPDPPAPVWPARSRIPADPARF